jgi:hypothetical protein
VGSLVESKKAEIFELALSHVLTSQLDFFKSLGKCWKMADFRPSFIWKTAVI